MSQRHFTSIERGKIEELNNLGYSSPKIALRLYCHRSSISRELGRFKNPGEYNAITAQHNYSHTKKKEAMTAAEEIKRQNANEKHVYQ